VDARVLAPRRSHADARVCCDPRGRYGSIRKKLAARVSELRNHFANPAIAGYREQKINLSVKFLELTPSVCAEAARQKAHP
jgi:hypothetical protein